MTPKKLLKVLFAFMSNNEQFFKIPRGTQERILSAFPQPKDDLERSFFQYKCQCKTNGPIRNLLLNLGSLVYLPFYRAKGHVTSPSKSKTGLVLRTRNKIPSISMLPSSLQTQLTEVSDDFLSNECDESKVINSLLKKRYFWSFYFRLKCKIILADYSGLIARYSPQAIVSANEFSFTSSVATYFCEKMGVNSFDVLHGEKLFSITCSFFRFTKTFVWDDYDIKLLSSLKAPVEQFSTYEASFLLPKAHVDFPQWDYTYYLQMQNKKELQLIARNLSKLRSLGNKVQVRFHPKYTNQKMAIRIFGKFGIAIDHETIDASIANSKHCISQYSTVMYQSLLTGKAPVIDDLSNPLKFQKLKTLDYRILIGPHLLLSGLLQN
jgi:hypothetical protein